MRELNDNWGEVSVYGVEFEKRHLSVTSICVKIKEEYHLVRPSRVRWNNETLIEKNRDKIEIEKTQKIL